MRSLCAFVVFALLALAQIADAWYIALSNMTGFTNYQQFTVGCFRPPKYYEGDFNQGCYQGQMIYLYEKKDCTGTRTVLSKSHINWINVYHPIRSYKILAVDH
ncbi:hypothetical protein H4R19_003135 [Coemansia spiralis]|nr:hypothetical protein H4R19_003135 [Coemansia spiralis]